MRFKLVILALLYAIGVSTSGCATPAPRVAMVVGNGQYQHAQPLTNPPNDAREVARRLEQLGWQVSTAIDLPRVGLENSIASFEKQVEGADQAIFFYAGHSMQVNGENFIVPVEFEPKVADLGRDLVSLNAAVDRLATSKAQVAILLDASRDNPLATAFEEAAQQRGNGEMAGVQIGRGLAELPASDGTFVAFATAPGHVAFDGTSGHSPFSQALLKHIDLQNQDVRTLLVRVRNDVVDATGGSQVPWDYSSLVGDFLIYVPQSEPAPTSTD